MTSRRIDGLTSGYNHPGLVHSDVDFTPNPTRDQSKIALSNSPTRPMPDRITMRSSSTTDRLMMTMGTRRCIIEHRVQTQLTSSSLGLTPVLGTAGDVNDMFAGVMTGPEDLC